MELRTRAICALLALFFVSQLSYFWKTHAGKSETGPATPSTQHTQTTGERRAYATFLSTRLDSELQDDPYFTSVRVLAYQLLHNPETRTRQSIPFLVLVPPHVSPNKTQVLEDEGCTIVRVPLLEPTTNWFSPGQDRWLDQFTKLRLWQLTQYERILYIDGDMLLTRPLDGIWSEEITLHSATTKADDTSLFKPDEPVPPSDYLVVGVSDTGGADHEYPPPTGDMMNGGFFMLKPSAEWFAYYTAIMNIPNRFDSTLMEQSLLNYVHRQDGCMPWLRFPAGKWNVNWPNWRDVQGGAASLHDKFWEQGNLGWIDRRVVEMWWRVRGRGEGYWAGIKESTRTKTTWF